MIRGGDLLGTHRTQEAARRAAEAFDRILDPGSQFGVPANDLPRFNETVKDMARTSLHRAGLPALAEYVLTDIPKQERTQARLEALEAAARMIEGLDFGAVDSGLLTAQEVIAAKVRGLADRLERINGNEKDDHG